MAPAPIGIDGNGDNGGTDGFPKLFRHDALMGVEVPDVDVKIGRNNILFFEPSLKENNLNKVNK